MMDNTFEYIETNPLQLEDDYPYTHWDLECAYDKSKGVGQVHGYVDIP